MHAEQSPGLFVVALGASAGGLEAIHEFFDHTPHSDNVCFVIIQHLSSDHKSLLVELVAKHTHMQVLEARHGAEVGPGCVYVIPNDKLLSIAGGKLQLREKEQERGPNLAIDHFLFSLANDAGESAIALILSGTGSDGMRGGAAIRDRGGLVLVQDPATAKFDGMPLSAIQAGIADAVLQPSAMAAAIYSHLEQMGGESAQAPISQTDLSNILSAVHESTGYDFRQYKQATILRRISRRMANTRTGSLAQYAMLLQENREEPKQLAREFFIGVTSFFRDQDAFQVLREDILPSIFENKEPGEPIKIWVTACSTGQEAYSLAIMVSEYQREKGLNREVKIFATDVDERAIEVAAKGRYPSESVKALPQHIRDQYFISQDGVVIITPQIRKQIVFAKHNILKDPPFIRNDLVTCRNLLIYLNAKLQEGVMGTLYFSLLQGGYLFLGPSENPSVLSPELEEVNARWKVYRKKGGSTRYQHHNDGRYARRNNNSAELRQQKAPLVSPLGADFAKSLADDFGFAAIYVNEQYEVKEVLGDFRRYLSLPEKLVNLNILRMVPVELSGMLSSAFRRVAREKTKLVFRNTRINVEGTLKSYHITVHPPAESTNYIMVVLGEMNTTESRNSEGNPLLHRDEYVQELEEELKETRLNLQMAVEGLETTNEELQSANEELQSANEELQSSNEELQSLNEELHTLNTEHQVRIRELKQLNDDLDNYFRSTEIGQIFLDGQLNIRKFNPAATQMVNVIESDIGRPIGNISTNIRYADLQQEIEAVVRSGTTLEKEVELTNGTCCLLKILPYLRYDKQRDGVVVSFVDITAIRNLDTIIKGVFDTITSGLLVFEAQREGNQIKDFRCSAANNAASELVLGSNKSLQGQLLNKDLHKLQALRLEDKLKQVVNAGKQLRMEVCLPVNQGLQWFNLVVNKLNDGLIMAFTNITSLKESEEKLRTNYNELLRTKESLKELNASLEQKVQDRTRELSASEERFRLVAGATNDAIWDWEFAENRIWWSDSFYALFGYGKDDLSVHTAQHRMEQIHPDDRQAVQKGIYGVINSGGLMWSQEYRFRRKDGTYAVILDRGTVMQDEWGVPYRMLGAMMDITTNSANRQLLEEKNAALEKLIREFSFVTDFMPQMVWASTPDGYHDFFNRQWYAYTGLSFEETKADGWSLILHPEDLDRTWKVWQHSLQTGTIYETEYRMRRHDGVYRWFLARALPMRDQEGVVVKWFGTCTDIHDQKTANDLLEQKVQERTRDLQQSNSELEVSNNELMQFASIASHDLKEPLRKIHIFSSIVRDRYHPEDGTPVADYLDRIIRASARMTRLINDLLDYSRLSADSLFQPTDLDLLVKDVLHDIELAIADKKAVVQVSGLPVIDAIPGQLRQIFQNLISNAIKFSRDGVQPEISIKGEIINQPVGTNSLDPNGRYCRLTIKDNGIGFDDQYAQKIFVIFQRLHSRESYEGTGIGLAIARKIVERHGGVISASGVDGAGAEFTILLPMKQEQARG